MILSRLLSLIFRFAEFVCAAVVMGLMAHFLNEYRHGSDGPLKREIYTLVISVIALLFSLVWMIPFTSSLLHYPFDFLMAAAFFAAFGLLVNQVKSIGCGGAFHWGGLTKGGVCNQWKASEAFTFIGACFWLASALLGIYVFHKVARRDRVQTTHTTRRRRWGRRSYV